MKCKTCTLYINKRESAYNAFYFLFLITSPITYFTDVRATYVFGDFEDPGNRVCYMESGTDYPALNVLKLRKACLEMSTSRSWSWFYSKLGILLYNCNISLQDICYGNRRIFGLYTYLPICISAATLYTLNTTASYLI